MYKYMLLIFLSLGIHSHFVPLKITTSHSQRNIHCLVREIIHLLNNTHLESNEKFIIPTNIKCPNCSHKYTNEFIHELQKINKNSDNSTNATKVIEQDMKALKNDCPFLEKSPNNPLNCQNTRADFDKFKKDLETFVSWINQENMCNKTQEMDKVYTSSKNHCAALKND